MCYVKHHIYSIKLFFNKYLELTTNFRVGLTCMILLLKNDLCGSTRHLAIRKGDFLMIGLDKNTRIVRCE